MATKTKSKKSETATNILNVAFVWDMSGSMARVTEATRAGTHSYLSDLQKEERKLVKDNGEGVYTHFSLTAFDTVFERWAVDKPISEIDVSKLVGKYQPRGWTALYDAIANTITEIDSKLKGARRDEKVLVVVMTDGQENSSIEYGGPDGKKRIFDLIKAYEAKGNWTFVYLGANVDAFAESGAIGFSKGNTAYYSSTPDSIAMSASSLSSVTSTRRASGQMASANSFEDAGMSQDYRDQSDPNLTSPPNPTSSKSRIWTPGEKSYSDSSDATDKTRKAR